MLLHVNTWYIISIYDIYHCCTDSSILRHNSVKTDADQRWITTRSSWTQSDMNAANTVPNRNTFHDLFMQKSFFLQSSSKSVVEEVIFYRSRASITPYNDVAGDRTAAQYRRLMPQKNL